MVTKFKPPTFLAAYAYDTEELSNATAYVETMESLTVQSMAEEADINVLMHRYGITGKMPDNPRLPQYGDFTQITSYRDAVQAIMNAEEGFMELTARVRARFDNDPQQLLEFIDNPANRAEAITLGLIKEQPQNAINVNPSQTPGADARAPAPGSATNGVPAGGSPPAKGP